MPYRETLEDLVVKRLSEHEFANLQLGWRTLLGESSADPLFMSWAWLYSWWEVWSEIYGLELMLLGVYRKDSGQLVGLAPLYYHEFRSWAGIGIGRLHFIGNAWRIGPSVRTEYVGLIALKGYEDGVARATSGFLRQCAWGDLLISDSCHRTAGAFGESLKQSSDVLIVVRNEAKGVCIDTDDSYSHWLQRLGANTRLKAINRRRLFESKLQGECRPFKMDVKGYDVFFKRLNQFHRQRWGKPCFEDRAVEFHIRLLDRLDETQTPRLSELVCDNNVISVLYDIQAAGRVYNLQSGFDESFHRKISLGTLHLGYAISTAFKDPSTVSYDLLAGYGKNTFYKANFKGEEVKFTTVEFVRSPLLKLVYRCQNSLPQGIKSRINRVLRL